MPDALRHIRVLEVTTAVAGPTACHVLGDMGAEVIKIEEPRARAHVAGATPSASGAPARPYNRVATFNELNRSKRHIPLDLRSEPGRELFLKLVEISDVVIENFAPRVMGNLGLDYDTLSAINPGIVMVSMPAFGKTGPYRDRSSYGPGIDAMSGLSHLTGYPDRAPSKPGNYFCDQNAALHAVFCTLAALQSRGRTGRGQYIELAMLEGELQFVAPAVMDYILNGRVQARIGNRHYAHAPQGVYPCRGEDEWVALTVASDEQWRALCGVLDDPALAGDERLATADGRQAAHDAIDARIAAWTSRRTKQEAQDALQAAGISAGAALRVDELFENPQLQHRESFSWVEHAEMGRFPHTRSAWRSRSGNHGVSAPAPLYGEGVNYVLGDLAGRSPEQIEGLIAAGVTGRAPVAAVPPAQG